MAGRENTGDGSGGGRHGRAGAEATRAAIIASARELFAAKGYAGASVRQIAQGAGVDASLINHYFGGKERLFQTAMELPVDPVEVIRRLAAESGSELPALLVEVFLDIWEDPATGPQLIALLRRSLDEPERFAVFAGFITTAMAEPVSQRLEALGPEQVRLRFTLVASHLLGTVLIRRVVRVEPLASLSREELAALLVPVVANDLALTAAPPDGAAGRDGNDPEGARP